MTSFAHRKLLEQITKIDTPPNSINEYKEWIKARSHLDLLELNSQADELIIFAHHDGLFATHDRTYIDSVLVPESVICPLAESTLDELAAPDFKYPSNCTAIYSGSSTSVDIDSGFTYGTREPIGRGSPLVFRRIRPTSTENSTSYLEVLQDYVHVSDIHWWSERNSYCRINNEGELEDVISITCEDSPKGVVLASFAREPLEQYLAATNSVLVRLFSFELTSKGALEELRNRTATDEQTDEVVHRDTVFYRQAVKPGCIGWTDGAQIVGLSRPKHEVVTSIFGRARDELQTEFIVWDFRNDPGVTALAELTDYPGVRMLTARVSTDQSSTTSYFAAEHNSLPFDTSPAFFRPALLHKYKADRDQYMVGHGRLSCRETWSIKYDTNEANQVFAYMNQLRRIPYSEQQHWKSFNEEPRAGISETSLAYDFKADISYDPKDPLLVIKRVLERWCESASPWWRITDDSLLLREFTPLTNSREEWAGAFKDLAELVVAGFRTGFLRLQLEANQLNFDEDERDRSLALLERLRTGIHGVDEPPRLKGLREVQHIRSKVGAHFGGSEATELSRNALRKHGSYTSHFNDVCRTVAMELKIIEGLFS